MRRFWIAALLLSALATAQSRPPIAHRSLSERVQPIFAGIGDAKSPGIAVEIWDKGQSKFLLTRGLENLQTRKPITQQTNFRLASCTKQFTAMAIMLLVHDGRLKYDDHLTDIFPEFPAYGKNITVRNLLNHTSGLPDYEDLMDLASKQNPGNKTNNWSATHQITDHEVLRLLESADHGKFVPGTQWAYSNSGYVVLGLIIAQVSHSSFPQFLHERIFAILGMEHTVAHVAEWDEVENRAFGYSRVDWRNNGGSATAKPATSTTAENFIDTDQSSTSATLGDGGIYSNLKDLAKWDAALAAHTLLSAEEMRPALVPFKLPNGKMPNWSGDSGDTDPQHGKPVTYGFGWFLDPLVDSSGKPHPRMWHYGDTSGFKSAIMRFNDGLTIIVLTNRTDIDPAALAAKAALAY